MVRRRTRAAKGNAGMAAAVAQSSLLEDQYFASPKRKDCKISDADERALDMNGAAAAAALLLLSPNGGDGTPSPPPLEASPKALSPGRSKTAIAGKIIGVPLATRSQVRTIENFFKAKTAAKNAKLKDTAERRTENDAAGGSPGSLDALIDADNGQGSEVSPSPSPPMHADFLFGHLSEDTNDSDRTELSDEAGAAAVDAASGRIANGGFDFGAHGGCHRSPTLRDSRSSRSSTNTENIFLQEPVLTLNVDKTLNQASSITIKKSLDLEPIFSSPPSLTSSVLNGRFNQIVSLNGHSPSKRDSFGFEAKPLMNGCAAVGGGGGGGAYLMLPDNDNSSCDSGIAVSALLDNNNTPGQTQSRRRKPATPHRIVCPSPVKAPARVVSPSRANAVPPVERPPTDTATDHLSPRKSPRYLVSTGSKTRRRLNQQKEHAPYPNQSRPAAAVNTTPASHVDEEDAPPVGRTDSGAAVDEEEPDQEFENLEECAEAAFGGAKSILNAAKHPTAQQNTTNNNNSSNNNNNNGHKTKSKSGGGGAHPKQPAAPPRAKLAATNGNRELTEFFPVRRSVRKTKTVVKEEMMRNLELAILEERADGLKVAHFEGKGRGIVAARHFQRGEFVVEYIGDLISMSEAVEREQKYALDKNAGCYMYYFKHKNQQFCIDATVDTGRLGRLVNHSRNGNLITKVVVVKQRPHLVLIAKDDIEADEELTYDYGDRSKLSLLHHPWLAF